MGIRNAIDATWITVVLTTFVFGCSVEHFASGDPTVEALVDGSLRRFRDMAEFDAYMARVKAAANSRQAGTRSIPVHLSSLLSDQKEAEAICDPALQDCGNEKKLGEIVTTGSRVATRNTSITNNQEADVDEGDIVKQVGRFLVVLKDGRLFTIDTGARSAELRLVDRINLYDSPEADVWYDELLIHGNRLVVTGFNYGEDLSEITVLSIDTRGVLAIESRVDIRSEDYYSGSNYASRLVRGALVVYMPVDLSDFGPLEIPQVRRWTPEGGLTPWTPLFAITDVYRPIQETLTPTLHVVSICGLSGSEALECRTRGVIGPEGRELYVSSDNVYLWLTSDYPNWGFGSHWPGRCPEGVDTYNYDPLPAAAFQISLRTNDVRAVHTIGWPPDQFALDERDGRLLALLAREPATCHLGDERPMSFASIPLDFFSHSPRWLGRSQVTRLPSTHEYWVQNRFARDYLVYAGSRGYWPVRNTTIDFAELVLVPLREPWQFTRLNPSHSIERLEIIGINVVGFGFAAEWDLGVSTLDLRRAVPRIASTRVIAEVRESEGRSHAFNALVADDGSGMFGLPTVYRSQVERRWDAPSDVQFFTMNSGLAITPVGELAAVADQDTGDYECEVSCEDWYGNARPIFTNGRIFALNDSELIEGEIRNGTMVEIARLRLTGSPFWPR